MLSKKINFVILRVILLFIMLVGLIGVYPVQAESMEFGWVQGWGGPNMDYGTAIAIDNDGNTYSTGFMVPYLGNEDIIISKLYDSGNLAWSKLLGGTGRDNGRAILTDSAGNIYVTGIFSGTVDFDPGIGTTSLTSIGSTDVFILKLNNNGNLLWVKGMGGSGQDEGTAITMDDSGNLYIAGFYSDIVDFDPDAGTTELTSNGMTDNFVLKLTDNGNLIWAKSMGGTAQENNYAVTVDESGNVFTTGAYSGTVDFDPGPGVHELSGTGGRDIFVSKLDVNGEFAWVTRAVGALDDSGTDIVVDKNGQLYVTGFFRGTLSFDSGIPSLTSAGDYDILVGRIDENGSFVWAKRMGAAAHDASYDIAVDAKDYVYFTGEFSDTVDFDPGTGISSLTSSGSIDIFVSKLDQDANFVWAKKLGGTSPDLSEGIVLDAFDHIYLTGSFSDVVDFDLGQDTYNLTSSGDLDIFVTKMSVSPQTYYVNQNANGANNGSSWEDGFIDLQAALAAASSGDEIWVAAGTYKPTAGTDRTVSFNLKNGVALYGGFNGTETLLSQRDYETNSTVLSGDLGIAGNNTDNTYHVVAGKNTSASAILDGFTITAGNANGPSSYVQGGGIYNEYSSPTLSNLIVDQNVGGIGTGVFNFNSSPTFTNVIFRNNTGNLGSRGGALVNDTNSSPKLTNVTFFNNSVDLLGAGMSNSYNSNPYLVNVTFVANSVLNPTSARGGAIYNWQSNPTLLNVTFSGNSAKQGGAVYNDSNSHTIMVNAIMYGDAGGEIHNASGTSTISYSIVQGGYAGTGNIDADPLLGPLQDNGGFTPTMAPGVGSPAIDAGDDANCPVTDQRGITRLQNSHCDIGAVEYQPGIRHVKWNASGANDGTSWEHAFTDLQSALAAASSGDEIWVAAGTYKPTAEIDRIISFQLKNGVELYGGFAGTETLLSQRNHKTNITTLSGDIGTEGDASDNSYHVVVGSNTDASAILDGFTITGGNANTPDAGVAHEGGGMYNTSGSPTLSNLVFSNNSAVWGGGIANDNDSNPTLKNITFRGNTTASQTIQPPSGGGIYNSASSPSLENVTFHDNLAGAGGGMFNHAGSSPTLLNVTFSGNTAEYGSGIFNRDVNSHPVLDHVTLHGNTATYSERDGGSIADAGGTIIKNSIAWGNVGGSIVIVGPGTTQVTYSIIEGGYAGIGNLDTDPLLGPLQDNGGFTQTLALGAGSPAIDAGDDANCPDTDQRGVNRPQGVHCDMGAYEYDGRVEIPTLTPTATLTATPTKTATPTGTHTPTPGVVIRPKAPFLDIPANGSLVTSLRPVLDWKRQNPYAHHYHIQISTNSTFTALVVDERQVMASTFTLASDLNPAQLYYWRVRALTREEVAGDWSVVWKFKTPLAPPSLVSPAMDAVLRTDRPTFAWDRVPAATSYILQVSSKQTFSTLLVNATVHGTEYSMPKDLPSNKTLYWRVRAKTSLVTGPWSAKWTFTTGNPPSVPVLSSPANGVLVKDYTPRFNWQASTGAGVQHYEIEVDEERDFSSPVIETTSATSDLTPSADLASNTQFYWRVRSVSLNGHTSGWSPVWSLRTVIAKPGSLTMIPNAENPLRPSFEWDDAAGTGTITGYTIQISTRADFNTLLVNSTAKMSIYAMLKDLPAGKTIYWRVRVNGANGPSAWTIDQFTIPNP